MVRRWRSKDKTQKAGSGGALSPDGRKGIGQPLQCTYLYTQEVNTNFNPSVLQLCMAHIELSVFSGLVFSPTHVINLQLQPLPTLSFLYGGNLRDLGEGRVFSCVLCAFFFPFKLILCHCHWHLGLPVLCTIMMQWHPRNWPPLSFVKNKMVSLWLLSG